AVARADTGAAAGQRPGQRGGLSRADGPVPAGDAAAPISRPPFDDAAMDGFALRHADLQAGSGTTLRLVGEQFAGRAIALEVGAGECARITTGAPLPAGTDTVVMKENTRVEGDQVSVLEAPPPHRHVRRAGEDTSAGERILHAGDVLTPARIALAASQGLAELDVVRRPTVAVFTTGDELVEPGLP